MYTSHSRVPIFINRLFANLIEFEGCQSSVILKAGKFPRENFIEKWPLIRGYFLENYLKTRLDINIIDRNRCVEGIAKKF